MEANVREGRTKKNPVEDKNYWKNVPEFQVRPYKDAVVQWQHDLVKKQQ